MDRKKYSFYLSEALDALGFSYECIKHRQKSWELCGDHLTADEDENVTDLIAGSKAEGVSRVFEGDYDLMVSLNNFICYGSIDDMAIKSDTVLHKNNDYKGVTTILYQRTNQHSDNIEEKENYRADNIQWHVDMFNDPDETITVKDIPQNEVACRKLDKSDTKNQIDGIFLMDTENISPGYTILKVMHLEEKKLLDTQIQEQVALASAKVDRNGSCILSSKVFSDKAYECDEDEYTESVAGPAGRSDANKDFGIICDSDSVFCIPCVCKAINKSWSERRRKFGWPGREVIDEVSKLDGHVVPVGFKGSETSNIEWRICYTLSEIKLIQSFNETQIKLHALIKIVGKKILHPKCPDITSYILKNLLLWMAEKIPTECFIIENLYGLLMVALKYLRHTIKERNLPNYMIPKRNLYFGKLPEEERKEVLNVLDDVINCKCAFIETYEEFSILSRYIRIAVNDHHLIRYMESNRLDLEILFRQNWREIWEDRVYNFLPLCLEQSPCLKAIVSLCDMVNASSKIKQIVVERVFWWVTGRNDGEAVKADEACVANSDAYWKWDENGVIRPIYYDKILNKEQIDEFFHDK
jgi:hypothetical protein